MRCWPTLSAGATFCYESLDLIVHFTFKMVRGGALGPKADLTLSSELMALGAKCEAGFYRRIRFIPASKEEEEAGVPAVGQVVKQGILHEFGDWDPQLLSLV